MKLLDKLGLTMEDIRLAQKKAAADKALGKRDSGVTTAKATGNVTAASGGKTSDQKKQTAARQKTIQVRNTNTAMGKALAAAMGGVVLDGGAENAGGKTDKAQNNRDDQRSQSKPGAQATTGSISSLERRIKDKKMLAEELGIGEITLTDILKELEKPARDPRDDMPKPILRSDVLDMKDLKPGMILKGTVRNVIDFGVFVDIGVHQDGLVHISQITERFIKHPLEAVSVGDIVEVQVLGVDAAKKRISLTMKINAEKK